MSTHIKTIAKQLPTGRIWTPTAGSRSVCRWYYIYIQSTSTSIH